MTELLLRDLHRHAEVVEQRRVNVAELMPRHVSEPCSFRRRLQYAAQNRYLLFTITYASVLFLAGISGKFKWPALDLTVLVLGAVTLLAGVAIMIALPRV